MLRNNPHSNAAILLLICLAVSGALYGASIGRLVTIWWTSAAYQALMFVPLLSLYFVWLRRETLAATPIAPSYGALPLLVAAVALWAVSNAAFVAFGEFVALVGMIHALVLAILGVRIYRALLFPLWLLWLMVPIGDNLFPPLVSLTVQLSKLGLWATGAQVAVDGSVLVTGVGRYGVIQECSSLPFIIGNLIVSLVFAQLMFDRMRKRSLYVVLGVVMALFGNVLRIVSVIRLTELSDGAIDLVSDHRVYGWFMFLLVILAQMWIGARFADPVSGPEQHDSPQSDKPAFSPASIFVPLLALLVLAFPRILAVRLDAVADAEQALSRCAPPPASLPDSGGGWRPVYDHADTRQQWRVQIDGYQVDVFVGGFRTQASGREVVGWPGRSHDDVNFGLLELAAPTGWSSQLWPAPQGERLRTPTLDRRRVWTWYWADGVVTGRPWGAKLLLARGALFGRGTSGAVVMLSTQENHDPAAAEAALGKALQTVGSPAALLADRINCR